MAHASQHQALHAPQSLGVRSRAFEDGRAIPREHTAHGDDVSPPLAWTGVPEDAQSLAIVVDDPDAPTGTFTHWAVWDLPADLRELERGVDPVTLGARVGRNDFGFAKYMGPKPPSGTHRYVFRVFAVDKRLGLDANMPVDRLWRALAGHVLAWGETVGTFARP